MKTGAVAIILSMVLSLEALLLITGLSAAAVSHEAISLPSDGAGLADLLTAMTRATRGEEKKRPWKCCDMAVCTRSFPPICVCRDKVDRCSRACENCEKTEDSRHTCADWYHGFPGPRCNNDKDDRGGLADPEVKVIRDAAAASFGKNDEKMRPWRCCDLQVCTRSQPPICHCWDEVPRCGKTCKRCEEVEDSEPSRYRCLDAHRGDPGPRCHRDGGVMQRAVDAIRRGYGY